MRRLSHYASFIDGWRGTAEKDQLASTRKGAPAVQRPVAERRQDREGLIAILRGQIPDRIPIVQRGYWPETIERWQAEGLPATVCTPADAGAYFGTDVLDTVGFDNTLRLAPEVLDEDDEFITWRDSNGILSKAVKGGIGIMQRLDALIKTRADWLRYRERLVADPGRFTAESIARCRRLREAGHFATFSAGEPCWRVLTMMDEIEGLVALAAEPDWIEDMVRCYTEMAIGVHEMMRAEGAVFDGVWMSGDLGYRNGLLFSPQTFRRVVLPSHKRLAAYFHEYDMPVIWHCDGNVAEIIPLALEAGFACMQPLEARAGNDVRTYKKLYGTRIAFMGNLNADVMETSYEAIEEEIRSKTLVAKEGGGYVLSLDHGVPPTISLARYRFAVGCMRRHGAY